jgi:hypothetical protein
MSDGEIETAAQLAHWQGLCDEAQRRNERRMPESKLPAHLKNGGRRAEAPATAQEANDAYVALTDAKERAAFRKQFWALLGIRPE